MRSAVGKETVLRALRTDFCKEAFSTLGLYLCPFSYNGVFPLVLQGGEAEGEEELRREGDFARTPQLGEFQGQPFLDAIP